MTATASTQPADDPSGIATYAQTGAHYGYSLRWTAVWQLPLLYHAEGGGADRRSARKGLASAIPRALWAVAGRTLLAALVVVADTINAAYCWFWQSDQEIEEELADRNGLPCSSSIFCRDLGILDRPLLFA